MRKPLSVRSLEQLGRVRLSSSFFMRDFLHSEIADLHGIANVSDDPDLAIAAGRRLCQELLEPSQAAFGRLAFNGVQSVFTAYGAVPLMCTLEAVLPSCLRAQGLWALSGTADLGQP